MGRTETRRHAVLRELSDAPESVLGVVEAYAGIRYDPSYLAGLLTQSDGFVFPDSLSILRMKQVTDSNQSGYHRDILRTLLLADEPICVVRDGARITVWNGTHRYTAAKLLGAKDIRARVLDL